MIYVTDSIIFNNLGGIIVFQESVFNKMKWSRKEVLLLLLLTLVVVPFFIEYLLHDFLYSKLQNQLYSGSIMGLVMAIVFTLGVYLIALRPYQLAWDAVGVRLFSKKYWKWIGFWTILLLLASLLIMIVMDWIGIGVENKKTESLQSNITWLTILLGIVSVAIISPVYEEIFYRGFLYTWFRIKWGVGAGLWISSIIFTIVHIPTYNTLPINFLSGMVFAWVYEKSGSVLPGMIIHGLCNTTFLILTITL